MRRWLIFILILVEAGWSQPAPPTASEQEAGFLFRQGLTLLEESQTARAEELFKKALRLEPERLEIRPYLAQALFLEGKSEESLRQLDLYLNLEPADAKVGLYRVKVLADLERYGQAGDALELLRGAHKDKTWEWHNLRGFLLEKKEQPMAAEEEYQKAIELAPKTNFEPRANLISLWLSQDKTEEATKLVSESLSEAPDNPQVLNAFALLLSKKEDGFDPSSLLDAVKGKDTPFELQYNLAAALAERRENEQAGLLAADLVDRFPHEARAKWLYGRILLQRRELQEAGEFLLAARDDLPVTDELVETMGAYSYLVGDYEEAVNWFQQAQKRNPNDAGVAHNLSLALSRADKLTEAYQASLRAVELKSDPRYVYQLALVLDRDGELERAARVYRRFLELTDDEEQASIVREHLAEIEGDK